MSDIKIPVNDQTEIYTIKNVYDSVGLQGPQGIQGPVGPAGPNEIGGFPVELNNPKEGDTLQIQSYAWKNTPQVTSVAGKTGNVTLVVGDVSGAAPLASPALTGTPTAPTAATATNSTQIATTAFVQAAVSALIDAAPGTLDTLNEIAAALGDDPNFAATITTELATKMVKANNLSDLTNAATARTNLGLGSIATQAASAVAITGGSITNLTTFDGITIDGGTF